MHAMLFSIQLGQVTQKNHVITLIMQLMLDFHSPILIITQSIF